MNGPDHVIGLLQSLDVMLALPQSMESFKSVLFYGTIYRTVCGTVRFYRTIYRTARRTQYDTFLNSGRTIDDATTAVNGLESCPARLLVLTRIGYPGGSKDVLVPGMASCGLG